MYSTKYVYTLHIEPVQHTSTSTYPHHHINREKKNSREFTRHIYFKKFVFKKAQILYIVRVYKTYIIIILHLDTKVQYRAHISGTYIYIYIIPVHRLSNAESDVSIYFFFGNCPVRANDLSVPDRCTVSREKYIIL